MAPVSAGRRDSVGGEIRFDYRLGATVEPAVVLFDYEAAPGREVTRLADNFRSFLERIGNDSSGT